MAVSKKIRFEVFKRDSFTCQYCGRSAPEIVLNLDHIMPRAKGGADDILNLITSCYDCNQGKKDRELSDDAVINKRKAQLDLLQERREQLEMMMDWQRGLDSIESEAVNQLAEYWSEIIGYGLTEQGMQTLRRHTRKFTIPELTTAMRAAADQYIQYDSDGKATIDSLDYAWKKIGAICSVTRRCKEKPYLRELYYARGILRNRLSYVDERYVMSLMETAVEAGVAPEHLRECAIYASSWTNFKTRLGDAINNVEGETANGPDSVN